MSRCCRSPRLLLVLLTLVVGASVAEVANSAERWIVHEGQPRAEIVIAAQPRRTVRLAARDLQTYVQKITGARLPIVTTPSADAVKLYVGRSAALDKLGVIDQGLQFGAYRLVSGDDWLAFIGDDTDFTPTEPWARSNGDIVSGKVQSDWEKLTGEQWGVPYTGMYKHLIKLPGDIGLPDDKRPASGAKLDPLPLWGFDERGSFNAVAGYLQQLGVRWYLPGELGEVVPRLPSVALPKIDETVRPDFPLRRFNFRFATGGETTSLWSMRLGLRDPFDIQVAHGLATMTGRDELFAKHPEWFALYGDKRRYEPGYSKNQLCYSNEELFQYTVRYARALFDHYPYEAVSIMPPDGYTAICQCPLCQGKDSPERDERGRLSDHVWDFVNRVAREVGKTHPTKKILNCAYGVYTLPPLKIAKLEPNVQVCIVGGRRPTNNRPDEQAAVRELRASWVTKTDNPLLIFENYPFIDRGWYKPAFTIHTLGNSVNETKGISAGEDIWLSMVNFETNGIALNHILVYFTARMYWGGKQADVDALFREYCQLFYGPASAEMQAFFEYCEAHWADMEKDKAKADAALALFDRAQAKVESGSVYARRVALIDDFLKGLRRKSEQLAQQRGPVPTLRLVGEPRDPIVIDGKFDEPAWTETPVASTGTMRELQTGRAPALGTSFKSAWFGNILYFAIRCEEVPGEPLNIAARKAEDAALWYGDAVEILLATDSHSYYQIAVSPSGAVVDLDRGAARHSWFGWSSQAEVATQIADDHWTVEIRIPVTQDENDPLHQVIGRKPTQSLPWHINLCRQRIREHGSEHSAFAPTGVNNFHAPLKFAHFFSGRSHQFDADASVTDFALAYQAAVKLLNDRKLDDALAAFVALSEQSGHTDLQRDEALSRAAECARLLKDLDRADQLAAQARQTPVADTIRLQNLVALRAFDDILTKYGDQDFSRWPFWTWSDALVARSRAHFAKGNPTAAQADLRRALVYTTDKRRRQAIQTELGEKPAK